MSVLPKGAVVRILEPTDEFMDVSFIGKVGIIRERRYSTAAVGETRSDPFYIVDFLGYKKPKSDGFWHEELEWVPYG